MDETRMCFGLPDTHRPLQLPLVFFNGGESLCKVCWQRRQERKEATLEEYLGKMGTAIKGGLHELAAHGYHPSNTIAVGFLGQEVPLQFRPSGDKRQGNKPRYGIKLVHDETKAIQVRHAWEMKLRGCSSRDIHEASHLYTLHEGVKNLFGSYHVFFRNTLYAGILTFGGIRYPLDWESGHQFCEPYISLEEYNQVMGDRFIYMPK